MPAQESSSVVQIGEWIVHPALDSISRGTETQKLEPRAMRLLMCLANSPGEVVSIDRLLNEVWAGVVVGSASVYEAVSQLRKILGDVDPQPTYIATVPRKGYRLIAPVRRGTAPAETSQAPAFQKKTMAQRRVWVAAGAIVVVALTVAYFSIDRARFSTQTMLRRTSVVVSDKSIAVLPFVDMSEKHDEEYFADGMAEEIINLLVKIPGLRVISRTSSFQFKGKAEDLRNIATQLGVAYVLEGSVRKSGDHLRVTAQLINAKDGTHLWSQTYDRDLSDVLKLQDEIAASLGRALQIELSSVDGIVSRPALRSTEAYTLYLQGLHGFERYDQQGLEQALSDFQRALELDPAFAAAAQMQGAAYSLLGSYGFMAPAVAFEKSRDAHELALKLDPNLAGAHAALGYLHRVDWDWPAADQEFQLALTLAPRDDMVLYLAGAECLIMGRWDEAVKLVNESLALDPLSPGSYSVLAFAQLHRGRLQEAEAAARRTLSISPTFTYAHFYLGGVLLARGQSDAALAEMLKEQDLGTRLGGFAMAYFSLGRKADSDAALAQMLKSVGNRNAFRIATVYAYRGEADEALKWLDRAYAQKDSGLVRIKVDPSFMKLEGDPRYKAFLRKMNLPEG
jgi:TolB-like protein/DNA-binding winged helix-turn-helix (wHTH) protein